jgi:hypothetical protein
MSRWILALTALAALAAAGAAPCAALAEEGEEGGDAAVNEEDALNALYERAVEAARQTGSPNAVRVLQKLVKEHPESRAGLFADGLLHRWKLHDFDAAKGDPEEVARRILAVESAEARMDALVNSAEELFNRGDFAAARAALMEVVWNSTSPDKVSQAQSVLVSLRLPDDPKLLAEPETAKRLQRELEAKRMLSRAQTIGGASLDEDNAPDVRVSFRKKAVWILKEIATNFQGTSSAARAEEYMNELMLMEMKEQPAAAGGEAKPKPENF